MEKTPQFDLIVFGATGFTGQLVAEYLHKTCADSAPLAWAMAGRSLEKLERVRDQLGISNALPLLVAHADDPVALQKLVAQAKVVITTVGPYQRHGQALAMACALAGTDYVDLCGEPGWMAKMIPLLQGPAAKSGARIVFSCGFDSVPFDLGVVQLQHEAQARLGAPLVSVRGRVKVMKGGFSGGTAASLMATLEAGQQDPSLARTLANPFALTPDLTGPVQPDDNTAEFDDWLGQWTAPFVMATINTKNVHRTNALLGHPWGAHFTYSERMLTGKGHSGEARARQLTRQTRLQNALLSFGPTRALIRRFVLPQPGQGPTAEQRTQGRYEIVFTGQTATGSQLSTTVKGDRDPGYGSTCKIITEAALCLLHTERQTTPGGVWTPGAAMGMALVQRLQAKAGLAFSV